MYVYRLGAGSMCTCEYRWLWTPEDGTGHPGAGVIGSCELSGMGPGNSGTLVEQVLLLITQPSLQPLYDTSSKKISAEPGLSTPSRLGEKLVEFSEVG